MCGLVGIAGKMEHRDEAMMKRLLVFDVFRGEHSTGMAAVRNSKEVLTAKLNSHPWDLFQTIKFVSALSYGSSQAFIGHNRAATKGAVTSFNAHPFTFGHITGVHNGTLEFSSHLELEALAEDRFDVDSQAVFAAIAKVGIEKVVPHMRGAWSLVWYDSSNDTLNFLRNKERPLWYCFTEDFTKMIWASEHSIITCAKDMATMEYKLARNERGSVYFQTDENIWYKYEMSKLKEGGKTRPKPTAKKLESKPLPAKEAKDVPDPLAWPGPLATGTNTTPKSHGSQTYGSGKNGATTTSRGRDIIELMGLPHDPYAGVITVARFEKLAEYGCSWCSASVEYGDVGVTVNDADDIILCADCSPHSSRNPSCNRIYLGEAEMAALG